MAIVVPTDMSAAATILQFWDTPVPPAAWITIFAVFVVVLNFLGVKLFGEVSETRVLGRQAATDNSTKSEVVFASLKIMLIIGLIIGGLVINLGGAPNHQRLGFAYWKDPGAFNEYIMTGSAGRFLAFWKVLLTAAFSFGNVQVVAIAGSETMNPRKVIPAATQKTFLRVFLFYFLSILIVGMIVSVSLLLLTNEVPYNRKTLVSPDI
jgi:amino acid transporter